MTTNIFPPTPSIEEAISLIEQVPARFSAEASKLTGLGKYQSDIVAQNFLQLIIKNIEGLLCLGRQNLLLLPPALNIARPILETGGNALWLMKPTDPNEREKRLISLLKEEDTQISEYLKNVEKFEVDELKKKQLEDDQNNLQKYCKVCEARIPSHYGKAKEKPKFRNLLEDRSLNLGHLYPTYRILCKSTHGAHATTWLYKRELDGAFGERIDSKDWYVPLFISWWTLAQVGAQFLTTFGGDPELFLPKSLREEINSSVEAIKLS